MKTPEVIVIGGNHHNTLSVLRALGRMGIKSHLVLITREKHPHVAFSRYKKSCSRLSEENELPEFLLGNYSNRIVKPVVIACGDKISSTIDLHHDSLSSYFKLPGAPEQGRITRLMNKENMLALAQKCGLRIPASISVDKEDIDDELLAKLIYPCIVKPLASIEGEKDDIHIFGDASSFKKGLEDIGCQRIQVQEFIHKDIEYQLIGCSVDGGKKVVIPGASVILRQPYNTNTGFLEYIPADEFSFDSEACRSFLQSTGYSGLFSMEFLRDINGVDYFMEINFRNDGNAICVTEAGVNLPYIWYLANTGGDIDSYINSTTTRKVIVMPEIEDFRAVRKGKLSLSQWLKDVRRTDAFMEFSKKDPMPLLHFAIGKFYKHKPTS